MHQNWQDALDLLTEIVNLPIPTNFGALMGLPPPIDGFIDSIIPSCFTSSISTKGLQHSNGLIRLKIAKFLCIVLAKLEKVIKHLLARSDNSDSNEWSACVESLVDLLQKRIPSWQVIISYHHSCISDVSDHHIESKRFVYRLVFYYQKCFSEWIEDSNFNYGKLILQDMNTFPVDIQYTFLEIMGNVKEFKWAAPSDSGDSYFKNLLNYFVSCNDREITEVALESLVGCLSNGVLFSNNSDYLHIILSTLQLSSKFEQEAVISFLDRVIYDAEKNSQRISLLKVEFNNLKFLEGMDAAHEPYFSLYWLIKCFDQVRQGEVTDIGSILSFFTRLILEQLYSMEETGDALFFLCSELVNSLSAIESKLELGAHGSVLGFKNALKIVQMFSQSRTLEYPTFAVSTPKNYSAIVKTLKGNSLKFKFRL